MGAFAGGISRVRPQGAESRYPVCSAWLSKAPLTWAHVWEELTTQKQPPESDCTGSIRDLYDRAVRLYIYRQIDKQR